MKRFLTNIGKANLAWLFVILLLFSAIVWQRWLVSQLRYEIEKGQFFHVTLLGVGIPVSNKFLLHHVRGEALLVNDSQRILVSNDPEKIPAFVENLKKAGAIESNRCGFEVFHAKHGDLVSIHIVRSGKGMVSFIGSEGSAGAALRELCLHSVDAK